MLRSLLGAEVRALWLGLVVGVVSIGALSGCDVEVTIGEEEASTSGVEASQQSTAAAPLEAGAYEGRIPEDVLAKLSVPDEAAACLLEGGKDPRFIDLRTSALSCNEAAGIWRELDRKGWIGFSGFYDEPKRYKGWACLFHPMAYYPLASHCTSEDTGRFLVLYGIENPRAGMFEDPPPEPPPFPVGQKATCGDMVESGAGSFDIRTKGIDCYKAKQLVATWEGTCSWPDPTYSACTLPGGMTCFLRPVGYESSLIQCEAGELRMRFLRSA